VRELSESANSSSGLLITDETTIVPIPVDAPDLDD